MKLQRLRIYGDAYYEIPAATIMSNSYYLFGILVLEIIIDEIFCWLYLLWFDSRVTGGMHKTDKSSLSESYLFYFWVSLGFFWAAKNLL